MNQPATFYIALYAAILSTLVAVWNIFVYFRDRMVKIKVEAFIRPEILIGGRNTGAQQWTIHGIVTNAGKVDRFLEMPNFALVINGKEQLQSLIDTQDTESFPKSFSPGAQYTVRLPFAQIWTYMQKVNADGNKIRIVVRDTLGKTYKSGWLKFSTGQIENFNPFQ